MRDYRAYILNIDGHRWVENFSNNHPNDAAALIAANQLTDKHDVEVWDGARLVALLPGDKVVSTELVPEIFSPDGSCLKKGPSAGSDRGRALRVLGGQHELINDQLSRPFR
jgi:hypothetical protein